MLGTNLSWTIISIISITIKWIILKAVLDEISKSKSSKLTLNIAMLISISIDILGLIYEFNPIFQMSIDIVTTSIFIIYNYYMSLIKGVFISALYQGIILFCEEIVYKLIFTIANKVSVINYLEYYTLLEDKTVRLELIIISNLILLSLIPITKAIKLQSEIRKRDYMYIIFSIISNIICVIVFFTIIFKEYHGITNTALDISILLVSFTVLVSSIFSTNLISRVIKDNRLRLENELIKESIDMQYKYYMSLKESQLEVRKLYHDMKNHMICIENLYGKNDYLKSISSKLEESESIFDTGNMILDIILNDKKTICDNSGIDLTVDINFSKCDFIDISDVCSIFSNMIDNSIEACKKINDDSIAKKIKIKGTIVNRLYVIKCENTKVNKVRYIDNLIITQKKDKFLHGIGITSIKSSVEKYDGNLDIEVSKYDFSITIYIPLIKKKPQLDT
ncbi:GHKL domain-containing protein [Romboutsia weinsteinii]|uniref:GHKL domain-containing protein n=1 Tax=Romboutsia weinsteinii TaxID=2020949 RepID=A0A371J497_9FIRM|nr:ATP-binding protein [Romboutsia weinsteinii]RDY27610.1 GHKL domain-containing protein [Romboutsia weinsteinii]